MKSILLVVGIMVVALAICVSAATEETTPVYNETTLSSEMPPCVIVEKPMKHIPEIIEPSTTLSTEKYYNVKLSTDVQDVIFAECEKYNIPPEIIVAMIERESQFNQYGIGDDGRSLGLMQIQPKHHIQRMIELGCTDLFDPIQNVTVGINILAELYVRYGDISQALVAYNGGSYKGTITNYAKWVVARAAEL